MKKILALATLLFMCFFCSACMAEPRVIELTWEQTICADFAGWRLYVSNTSGSGYYYVPNQTDPLSTLTFVYDQEMDEYYGTVMIEVPVGVSTTFYFALTALDNRGNESGYSDEDDITIFIAPPTTSSTSTPTTTTTIDNEPPEAPYNLEIIEILVKLILKNKKIGG